MEIFNEISLKNMKLKNKIVRSATHSMLGNLDGSISDEELSMFQELAANHVGLIIAGQFFVSKKGIAAPGSNELTDELHVEKAKKIMERVKKYGTKVIAQINHAGAKAFGEEKISPSPIDMGTGKLSKEMTKEEIERVIKEFINAACLAKKSNFDGVQVHCAHDYLLCEFITSAFNKRVDEYGGDFDGRFLIVKMIIEGIKEKCGNDFPVFVKVNSSSAEENEQYINDMKKMMKELRNLEVEAVEFSGTNYKYMKYSDHNYFLENAIDIRGDVDIPIMVVGGIRNFNDMEKVFKRGANMVSMCRPFICEPDLITKLRNGQENAKCVSCNKCFVAGKKRCILKV